MAAIVEDTDAQPIFTSTSEAMETWLSSTDADEAVSAALSAVLAEEGGGSNERNLSVDLVVRTCARAVAALPRSLAALVPPPDGAFVAGALDQVLPHARTSGCNDADTLMTCVQVVLLQVGEPMDKGEPVLRVAYEWEPV